MANSPQSVSASDITTAIKQLIVARTALNSRYVFLWQGDQMPRARLDDRMVLVRVSKEIPDIYTPGANRLGRLVKRNFTVRCCVRANLDAAGASDVAMERDDFGLLALEEAVLDALDGVNLYLTNTDNSRTILSRQPIQLVDGGEDPFVRSAAPEFHCTSYTFEVMYAAKRTLGSPDPSIMPQ